MNRRRHTLSVKRNNKKHVLTRRPRLARRGERRRPLLCPLRSVPRTPRRLAVGRAMPLQRHKIRRLASLGRVGRAQASPLCRTRQDASLRRRRHATPSAHPAAVLSVPPAVPAPGSVACRPGSLHCPAVPSLRAGQSREPRANDPTCPRRFGPRGPSRGLHSGLFLTPSGRGSHPRLTSHAAPSEARQRRVRASNGPRSAPPPASSWGL